MHLIGFLPTLGCGIWKPALLAWFPRKTNETTAMVHWQHFPERFILLIPQSFVKTPQSLLVLTSSWETHLKCSLLWENSAKQGRKISFAAPGLSRPRGVSSHLILLRDKLSSRSFSSLSSFSIFSIWLLLRFSTSSLEHLSKFSMY